MREHDSYNNKRNRIFPCQRLTEKRKRMHFPELIKIFSLFWMLHADHTRLHCTESQKFTKMTLSSFWRSSSNGKKSSFLNAYHENQNDDTDDETDTDSYGI
nr:uncharacterized protein LOC115261380 [Aedes albopictus]